MNKRDEEIIKLREAFDTLNLSTKELVKAYGATKDEASQMKLGMEESLSFLSDILSSLHCAVVVTGPDGEIVMENPEAKKLGVAEDDLIKKWLEQIDVDEFKASGKKRKIEWDKPDGKKLSIAITSLERGIDSSAGLIFIIDDVTEIVRLRKQSNRADRLATVGEVAAGMAHEVRNPLGGIEIFTSLLRRELEGDEEKLKMLSHISTGAQAINNVISNFLLFTREPMPVKKEFDIVKLITNTLEFAGYVFEHNHINVKAIMDDDTIPVVADPDLVRQALLNIIHNATQAMPDGGEFTISVKTVSKDGEKSAVEIICMDTGPGAPENIRDKIFDPFFTTKETGAGLGLAIVSQIVQAHGGYVDLLKTEGQGAGFIISFPLGGMGD